MAATKRTKRGGNDAAYQKAQVAALDKIAENLPASSGEPLWQLAQTLIDLNENLGACLKPKDCYDAEEHIAETVIGLYQNERFMQVVELIAERVGKHLVLGQKEGLQELARQNGNV